MTNAVGPILVAQKLLQTGVPVGVITFMSSDSASAAEFRAFEDGCVLFEQVVDQLLNLFSRFAAYAASKAALNQALRVRHDFS